MRSKEEILKKFEDEQLTGEYPLFFHNWFERGMFLGFEIRRHNKKQVRVWTHNDRGAHYEDCREDGDDPRETSTENIYNIKDCTFSIERQNAFIFRTPEKVFEIDIFQEEREDEYLLWEPVAVEEGYESAERQFPFMIKGLEAAGIKQTPL